MKKTVKTTIASALFVSAFGTNAALMDFTLGLTGTSLNYTVSQGFNSLGTETSLAIYDSNGDGLSDSDGLNGAGASYADGITMNYAVLSDSKVNNGGFWNSGNPFAGIAGDVDGSGNGLGDATFGDPAFADPLSAINVTLDGMSPGISYTDPNFFVDFQLVLETPIIGVGTYQVIEEYSFFDIFTEPGVPAWGLGLDPDPDIESEIEITTQGAKLKIDAGFSGFVFAQDLPWIEVLDNGDITISLSGNFDDPGIWDDTFSTPVTVDITGQAVVVPEPAHLGLFGLALTGMGIMIRRRKC